MPLSQKCGRKLLQQDGVRVVDADLRKRSPVLMKHLRPGDTDLYAIGFLCQPYSAAGGLSKGRDLRVHGLMPQVCSFIKDKLPKLFLLEEVVGFAKSEQCRQVHKALHAAGYKTRSFTLNIEEWVPQSRLRFYLVGLVHYTCNPTCH